MPLHEYIARDPSAGCALCRDRFEHLTKVGAEVLSACPKCGAPVDRCFSTPSIGSSHAGLDDRAKNAGFHKLKRLGHGEYEKQY